MTRWVHGVSKDILRAAFREYFGVSDEHVEILIVLYGRPGEWTPVRRLQILLDSHRPPKRQAVYERIRVLREALEPESLLSGGQLDDLGYSLSEVGFAECALALQALVEVLLRAGPQISIPPAEEPLRLEAPSPLSRHDADQLETAIAKLEATRPAALAAPASAPLRTPLRKAS